MNLIRAKEILRKMSEMQPVLVQAIPDEIEDRLMELDLPSGQDAETIVDQFMQAWANNRIHLASSTERWLRSYLVKELHSHRRCA